MAAPATYLTLHELQALIRHKVADSHPLPYWVAAEIGEAKVNYSGHCYLELVEKGGDNQVPKAKVTAVIWRNHHLLISSYFESATGHKLASGMKVLVKVTVNYHELYGLTFQITDIEPSFTLGDMEARRRETIARLKQEGVYDMNRETELPPVLQRLAVISSEQAAGYRDFMNELTGNAQGYRFEVTFYQSFMQGNETEDSVIAALDRIADDPDRYDAVVLIRGGGAHSDLAAFDSYRLCSHIAQFPLPVITGIGHDKDQSVADLVANTPVKTPTAAAVFVCGYNGQFEEYLAGLQELLLRSAAESLQKQKETLSVFGFRLNERTVKTLRRAKAATDQRVIRLNGLAAGLIRKNRSSLDIERSALGYLTRNAVEKNRAKLDTMRAKLSEMPAAVLKGEEQRLRLAVAEITAKDPARVLNMGYAFVRLNGKSVRSTLSLGVGDRIDIRLSDGTVAARVEEIKKE